MTDQQILDTNLLEALGLDDLPDDQKAQLVQNISNLVLKSAIVRILELLSEGDREALQGLIDAKGAESPEVFDFIKSKVPAVPDIFQEELIKIKRELIAQVAGPNES